jgi:diguanylate cyclase (GGDEF)-like protein/PAS domain S-box-containing protein
MSSKLSTWFEVPPPVPPPVRRFGVAIGSVLPALLIGSWLAPAWGQVGAYVPMVGALVVSAWYGGVNPALTAQLIGGAAAFLFVARRGPFGAISNADFYGLLGFLVVGKLVLFLTANLRWNAHLRQNKRDLELIARTTHDSLWEWDITSNRVHRSGNVKRIFGGSKNDSPGNVEAWRLRLHPEDSERIWQHLHWTVENGGLWEAEYRIRRNDGSYLPVSDRGIVVRDKTGKAVRMIGGVADISAQRQAEEQLIHNASHDALTGLPNRELFLARTRQAIESRRQQPSKILAVLFLDIDRFKVVNDSLGHAIGDELLAAVASRLKGCLRPEDLAARFGGDEFTLMLDGIDDLAAAARSADHVQELLAAPFDLNERHLVITASIGIATASYSDAAEDLLRHADIAMYRAKANGKARYAIFEPTFDTPAKDLLQLETDLRQALRQRSFQLYYQPIVSLHTGYIVSFEALLRWEHPRRGMLLPPDFLFAAEEAGLSGPLGHWILRESCRCLSEWRHGARQGSLLSINVNLSQRQFAEPIIADQVNQALLESGLEGRFLTLELTETMMLQNSEATLYKLQRLRDLGVRLAIDDFGKGYSSLGRLQDFPISLLKIDGSFVHRIETGNPEIVDAIIALAHTLKLEVTAEGIETEQQLTHLERAGCSTGQGFYFSNAVPAKLAGSMVQQERRWPVRNSSPENARSASNSGQ